MLLLLWRLALAEPVAEPPPVQVWPEGGDQVAEVFPSAADLRQVGQVGASAVRFYALAVFLRDTLRCDDARYLDGLTSGMVGPRLPGSARRGGPFAGLLVVTGPVASPR